MKILKPQEKKDYTMPTKSFFGRGAFNELTNLCNNSSLEKVLLICGGHFKRSKHFLSLKTELGKKLIVFPDSIKKSTFESINDFTDFCRNTKPDMIIAVGGGSILDTGKCGAILVVNDGRVEDYVKTKTRTFKNKGISFIAVPTTAGTGSEVTPWATVWGDDNRKYSLTDHLMFPDVAIVDPALCDSMTREITAETGIDALAQAIEAYWNVKHNIISDKLALKAINIIMENLEKAVNNPNENARDEMSLGSLTSGLAFSNTQTTICHSVSYPITAHWKISHGQAVSVTLPRFIEYTLPVLKKERKKALLSSLKADSEKDASFKIKKLMKSIGLKTSLSSLGIKKKEISLIVSEGYNPDRAKNAPRIPSSEELKEILLSIY